MLSARQASDSDDPASIISLNQRKVDWKSIDYEIESALQPILANLLSDRLSTDEAAADFSNVLNAFLKNVVSRDEIATHST